MDVDKYRLTAAEKARTADLMGMIPKGRRTVLEIGARDGYFSRLLAGLFDEVTALDLEKPTFEIPGVTTVQGDVTRLEFPDASFDCVVCTEVLEHVADLERAASEIRRVAGQDVVIGVPYRQDTRVGRTTCGTCGRINPPWGHVNEFDEAKLETLFAPLEPVAKSLVGQNRVRTNALSARLLDLAGNPWGTYDQDEPCLHCGSPIVPPASRSIAGRAMSVAGLGLQKFQSRWYKPHANWIHMTFRKR